MQEELLVLAFAAATLEVERTEMEADKAVAHREAVRRRITGVLQTDRIGEVESRAGSLLVELDAFRKEANT